MPRCDQCGNEYDKCFEIAINGDTMVFDCFECAIAALAPICDHCGCRVIGHGVEHLGVIYCCAHCARGEGTEGLVDRN